MNAGNKNTPSTHHPRRRNVTTLMVGLKKKKRSHKQKTHPKSGEPQRYSWGMPKKKKTNKKQNKQKTKNKKKHNKTKKQTNKQTKKNKTKNPMQPDLHCWDLRCPVLYTAPLAGFLEFQSVAESDSTTAVCSGRVPSCLL